METGIEMNVGQVDVQTYIDDVYEKKPSRPSRRMGASSIGDPCERATFLRFRWAVKDRFSGQQLRTFELGHMMEDVVIGWLREMGMVIEYTGNEQLELHIGPHFVCYADGLVRHGVPGAEKTLHALDVKIMADKYFKELKKKGLKASHPKYYAQQQCEMYGLSKELHEKVERGILVAWNRDTSEVYAERVVYDGEFMDKILKKAERVRTANELPPPLSENPMWLDCKLCSLNHFCHLTKESLEVNCRTCCHATAEEDGTWSCALSRKYGWGVDEIPFDVQQTGCRAHTFNPTLVPYPFHPEQSTEDSVCFEVKEGQLVLNGWEGIDSHELCIYGHPMPEGGPVEDVKF